MYWEILLLVQIWCIFISRSILPTQAFFVVDILNHIFTLQQQYFSITFNYVRCSVWFKLTSIYLMHYCHFEGQMFLHPMLQQAQLFSIALHRRGFNKRYRLHVTHWLGLYSTPPHAQMLPLNYCSLSPFCSNTSTVHWFYSSTWDCYCNILEYLSGFFCKGNAHHVLLSGDQQFQFISFQMYRMFSFCNGVKSPFFERLHRLIFCKILDLQNKETARIWLRKLEIFFTLERQGVLALKSALLHTSL